MGRMEQIVCWCSVVLAIASGASAQTVSDSQATAFAADITRALLDETNETFEGLISPRADAEQVRTQLINLRARMGQLRLHHAEVDEFREGPSKRLIMHMFARSGMDDAWRDVQILLDREPPHQILSLVGLTEVPEPVKLPPMGIQVRPSQEWLREYVGKLGEREGLSASLLVSFNGRPIVERVVGFADAERTQPLTPAHRFALGRTIGVFNAVIVAMLVEEGLVSFDAPVTAAVPALAGAAALDGLTIANVLSHNPGITVGEQPEQSSSLDDWAELLRSAEPTEGQATAFSDANLVIGAMVIESVTGRAFDEVLGERIVDELGMSQTQVNPDIGPSSLPRELRIESTARDMMTFAEALLGERFISGSMLESMTQPGDPTDAGAWGLGFQTVPNDRYSAFGASWASPSGAADFGWYVSGRELIVVALTREPSSAYEAMVRNTNRLILGTR